MIEKDTILYVDDERANLNAFKLLFEHKYNILTAQSSDEGLEVLHSNHISLVISDQKMPFVQGTDFLQVVKERWPEKVCILLTGYIDHEALEIAINKIGIHQYIRKPFDPIQMELVLDKALDAIHVKKSLQEKTEEFTRDLEIKVAERTKELDEARAHLAMSLEKEKELSELKSLFVATASHQFRTPLSVIQSNMGVLAMQKDNMNSEFKTCFERSFNRIKGSIERMTILMDDVLILGKLTAGGINLERKPVDLSELCKEIIATYDEIQTSNKKIEFIQEGKPIEFLLDVKLMQHAISNLISNAVKYSVDSTISPVIKLVFGEKDVTITVKDHGIGIPEKDMAQLFTPFYRASNADDFSGTGLGSAIAKEYIELNGGTLTVESKINQGSEFIIELSN